jgi:hypothetical protein
VCRSQNCLAADEKNTRTAGTEERPAGKPQGKGQAEGIPVGGSRDCARLGWGLLEEHFLPKVEG